MSILTRPAPSTPSAPAVPPGRAKAWLAALRPLVRRLHLFAGVLVAPLLAVLCLTGIAYALSPQLNTLAYHHELYVDHPGPARASLADQVRAVGEAMPRGHVADVRPAPDADRTTAVDVAVPGMSEAGGSFSQRYRTVYVDPTTGHVRGSLDTVSGRTPPQQWLRDLHGSLHLGTVGRWYSELAASWLPFVVTGGLLLWLARRRGTVREFFLPRRGMRPGRRRIMGRHAVAGVWLTVGLLFLTATGLTWSHYAGDRFHALVDALHGRTPHLAVAAAPHTPGAPTIDLDTAASTARHAGLWAPLRVTPPKSAGDTYTVAEISQSWPIHRDSVAVDPYTGHLDGRLDFADYPPAAKLTTLGIYAHQGTLFGWANQLALIALALGLLVSLASGYRMWWARRPPGRALPPAPARGSWRSLPRWLPVTGIAVTAALGWLLPLFGISLAAFLLAEYLLSRRRIRRSPTPRSGSVP